MNLYEGSLHGLHQMLVEGEISAMELCEAQLSRIDAVEPQIGAYLLITRELARRQAAAADAQLKARRGVTPLTGIPVALKDVLCTEGVVTTAGSRILQGYRPPYDATAVRRLAEAGAVTVGKTNCDEFAMGSSTENSAYHPVHNPWDLATVPGGSSGGSAAAVAAGEAVFALGTDTGGSIRQPAALCGVVGLKPTYGRVSRYGLIAFASSLDQVGPLTRDVQDSALVLQAIAGPDPLDSTCSARPVPDYMAGLQEGAAGLRIGVPAEYFVAGVQPEVAQAVREAAALLARQGAHVEEIRLPHTEYALPAYYLIAPAEASSNLARYDGTRYGLVAGQGSNLLEEYQATRRHGFGPEVRRRIMLGTYALSSGYYDAYYVKAQKVRTLIKRDFDVAFGRVDAIVAPTSPTVAFPLGARTQDPLAMYLADLLTIPVNLAGLPAVSIPCGLAGGLPVGMQVIGPPFEEGRALRVAYAYEQATAFHRQRPPLVPA
jgi:aspartyl-tRNA(Asn)/glutamyl-tRNA(Gln) amidotransferase subunit A